MFTAEDIRPLSGADEAGQCADLMVGSEPWITLKLKREVGLAAVTDRAKEVYAVRDEKGIAGFVVLDMRGLTSGYIQILCVRSDCRGQGMDRC